MAKVCVVGLGEDGLDGLSPAARARVESATLLAGGTRHLALCPPSAAERLDYTGDLKGLSERLGLELADPARRPVVLASGDPLFFGIADSLAHAHPAT